ASNAQSICRYTRSPGQRHGNAQCAHLRHAGQFVHRTLSALRTHLSARGSWQLQSQPYGDISISSEMKKILIIGATSAIAQATAQRYAAGGARLYLLARDPDKLDTLAQTLRARGAHSVEWA